jgi:hypothetical protein
LRSHPRETAQFIKICARLGPYTKEQREGKRNTAAARIVRRLMR